VKEDIFLDVFNADFIKIVKEIERKKKAKGITEDNYKRSRDLIGMQSPKATQLKKQPPNKFKANGGAHSDGGDVSETDG